MEYKTLIKRETGEITEKKSRFICTLQPVKNQDEAVAFIDEMRSKYWDATHNVYAYILRNDNISRYSDDGEPSGTSGIPSLNVLEGEGLFNVCAVITRYFGGTLLGTGGLVRAYSSAVKAAIENSIVVTKCLCSIVKIKCSYSLWGKVENILKNKNVAVKDIQFADDVCVYAYEKVASTDKLVKDITEKTDANAIISVEGEEFAFLDKEGKVVNML